MTRWAEWLETLPESLYTCSSACTLHSHVCVTPLSFNLAGRDSKASQRRGFRQQLKNALLCPLPDQTFLVFTSEAVMALSPQGFWFSFLKEGGVLKDLYVNLCHNELELQSGRERRLSWAMAWKFLQFFLYFYSSKRAFSPSFISGRCSHSNASLAGDFALRGYIVIQVLITSLGW